MAIEEITLSNGVSNRHSVALTSSRRVSMDNYYGQISEHTEEIPVSSDEAESREDQLPQSPSDLPPPYEAFLQSPTSIRRKFNIQPREDEGREELPAYSCAISLQNVFMKKMELEGAVHRAHDRLWYRVLVTLQGTALTLHKLKSEGLLANIGASKKTKTDTPDGVERGYLLKSYNLQHAEVGIAADYLKKKYVIRVRAEADQFLLSCNQIETFVFWLHSLFAAIDLAVPLDDRSLPRDLSIPRSRRSRLNRQARERNALLVREQREILAQQYPTLGENVIASTILEEATIAMEDTTPSEATRQLQTQPASTPSPPQQQPASLRRQEQAPSSSYARSTARNPRVHPNVVPETGKWAPEHGWSTLSDLQYAKRCLGILNSRAPRKSNLVIMKGTQWVVDWATGRLVKWNPRGGLPDYCCLGGNGAANGNAAGAAASASGSGSAGAGEHEHAHGEGEEGREWRVGQYGNLIPV